MVEEQREDGPCQGQYGYDEQDQDVIWGQNVIVDIAVDKVCQHAHNGDESDDFEESPKDETDCEEHLDGGEVCMSMWMLCDVEEAIDVKSSAFQNHSRRLVSAQVWKHAGSNDNHRVEIVFGAWIMMETGGHKEPAGSRWESECTRGCVLI